MKIPVDQDVKTGLSHTLLAGMLVGEISAESNLAIAIIITNVYTYENYVQNYIRTRLFITPLHLITKRERKQPQALGYNRELI